MYEKALGVFDSGVGGLTTVKEISKIMPQENLVYFGDTGRVPYGNKSTETVTKFALQDMSFLRSKNVKIIIAACGTVSSLMYERQEYSGVPFVNDVMPACKAALSYSKNKKIGVIGTTSTIKSRSYKTLIELLENKAVVYQKDCPLFVPLIENGMSTLSRSTICAIVKQSLKPLLNSDIDTLILGCTHYPLIKDIIAQIMGPSVYLIDSGKETAKYALEILKKYNLCSKSNNKGKYNFFVSDNVELFSEIANKFFEYEYNITGKVEKIDAELYCARE